MKKLDKIINKIYDWKYSPFLCLYIMFVLIHCVIYSLFGDDINNMASLSERTLSDYIDDFFSISNWSSRILTDRILGPVCYFMVIKGSALCWCIVDSFFITLIGISFYKMVKRLWGIDNRNISFTICGLLLSYPLWELSSAGWLATTCSYLWPLALGIWFLSNYIEGMFVRKSWLQYIGYSFGLLFMINMEGGSVFACMLFLGIFISEFLNKKICYTTLCFVIISMGGVCFHLFSTGNANRVLVEETVWFKNYHMLSFVDKLELTINRCTFNYILNYNTIFIIFSVFLYLAVRGKCKDEFYRIIGAIPLVITFLFAIVGKMGIYDNLMLGNSLSQEGAITIYNYDNLSSYISTLLGVVTFLCILISLYVILEKYTHLIIAVFVLGGGIASWMIMIFSPTIWASGSRPFTTLNFVFLGFAAWFASIVIETTTLNERTLQAIIWFFALSNVFNMIV